jgi:hypothetical protein
MKFNILPVVSTFGSCMYVMNLIMKDIGCINFDLLNHKY